MARTVRMVSACSTALAVAAASSLALFFARRFLAVSARVALGSGSSMILDEIAYLIVTKATDHDYVSRVSLYGGIAFISLAAVFLLILYKSQRG